MNLADKMTIVITSHNVECFEKYLYYLLYSLCPSLKACNFLIYYDQCSFDLDVKDSIIDKIDTVFKKNNITKYDIHFQNGGLLAAFYNLSKNIKTDYFLFLEHDWVFLKNPDFFSIIESMDKHEYVKYVAFKKLGNIEKQLNALHDYKKERIPFVKDSRIKDLDLIQCCYWSNNPFICKTKVMNSWLKIFITKEIEEKIKTNTLNRMGSRGVEQVMIRVFCEDVSKYPWSSIKDSWGVFIYGNVGMPPIIAHTDASNRYDGLPEQLGKEWIEKNKSFIDI